jgi:hypothetical protein
MPTLFCKTGEPFNDKGAIFSEDRKYRYALFRMWDINKPSVMFIGLNPSTANEVSDDATIRRVIRFAFDWGYGGVYMMNLFGLVTPYPEELKKCADPIGENNKWLEKASNKCEDVVCSFPEATERAKEVMAMFPNAKALIVNRDGTPRHPLYVPANTVPVLFEQGLINKVQKNINKI